MSNILHTSLNQNNSVLLATFKKVVKPLVRLFLEKGITYTLLLEELKQVFVEVASEEFKIDGKAQTDSRITLLTGVHRRDVNRFRNSSTKTQQLKTNFSAQLISQWLGNEKFLDENGRPKRLARSNKVNSNDTFDDLVMSVSKDIRSRPVLDEWLRTNIITLGVDAHLKLTR
jgi:pyridoxine/pyridoxamine 5'-phosphate oxidase